MKFFRDKTGTIVIIQRPNLPITLWAISLLGQKISSTNLSNFFGFLSFGFLFTWAWLEITSGVNYFRRVLGALVLVWIIISKF